ncbi:hypothetical protein [Sinomicrobium weinanense]|uniref:Uncharacterized protein n=1 Tax=Sinomicrobium weinanense TaxID=2842200 RepID=A0A926JQG2_9FLAO|nr:hypothetical protein [Sinomicrobium weinanense]MBC9795366.1 hypothetical protein [Sinomicrobium weinanense]MBU3122919.1 hypothetical protein [Sinomicrobium weinanense]
MAQEYLLAWLDTLVSIKLNPEKSHIYAISTTQLDDLFRRIPEETIAVQSKLKHQVFSLTREKHIRLIIVNYHTSLHILLDSIVQYEFTQPFQQKELRKILNALKQCFKELINFMEIRFVYYLNPGRFSIKNRETIPAKLKVKDKILCDLSTDQIALFLRAADELRIIRARSLRTVFKHIAPYLSTPHKKEISFEAMRVSAYKAEESDKEVVISELIRLIEKIKEY